MKFKISLFSLLWIYQSLVLGVASSLNEVKVINDFNACFEASMQLLKEKDSSLAVLIDPQTDPHVIEATLPMIKINVSDIPTELKENNSFDYLNLVNVTEERNSSAHVESTSNGSEHLSMPKSVKREKIRYLLFTKHNKNQFQVIPKDGTVEGTKWRPERKTKVLIHGLTSTVWLPPLVNIWSQHLFEIKDAYLKTSRDRSLYNVIVVDWTALSTVPLSRYPEAAIATQEAGEDLAEFLYKLKIAKNILNWEDVHLLGHSLGAHVAGITGNELRRKGREYMLGRITGLDPAGLCFDTKLGELNDPDTMLDSSDAKFVDIIHTNMGNLIKSVAGRYGSQMQTGHADFYPDGGEVQKGCNFLEDRLNFCSHQKSVTFYAQSITEKVVACPCSSWDIYRTQSCNCSVKDSGQYLGEHCSNSSRGKYFLIM